MEQYDIVLTKSEVELLQRALCHAEYYYSHDAVRMKEFGLGTDHIVERLELANECDRLWRKLQSVK